MNPGKIKRREFIGLAGLITAAPAILANPETKPKAFVNEQKTKRPVILVRSSWTFSNIGDIGITPGMLRLIQRYIPEAHVILSPAAEYEKITNYVKARFPEYESVRGHLGKTFDPPTPALVEAYKKADMLIYASGPIFHYGHQPYDGPVRTDGWRSFNWNGPMDAASPLYMARTLKKPYGIYGQEFNYFGSPSDVVFRDLFGTAAFLYTRDSDSLNYLKSVNVTAPEMASATDSTFGFDFIDEEYGKAALQRFNLKEREYMCVLIRSSAHSFTTVEQEKAHSEKLRGVITRWVRELKLPVLLAPETEREIVPGKKLIIDPLPEDVRSQVRYQDQFWMPDQAIAVYKRARLLLSMEPHSIILTLRYQTPCILSSVVMAGRKRQIMSDLGMGDWLFDIDKVSQSDLEAAVWGIHQNYSQAQEKCRNAIKIVNNLEEKAMKFVRQTAMQSIKSA